MVSRFTIFQNTKFSFVKDLLFCLLQILNPFSSQQDANSEIVARLRIRRVVGRF